MACDLAATKLDDVFTDLSATAGRVETDDRRPAQSPHVGSYRLTISFASAVVYNPPHRQAICIEPYTCVPDAYHLAESGVDTGLRALAPGDGVSTARIELRLRG